ncbi:hypothetical protein QO239_23355 [Cupriavidus taiwanensis]|uniref:hypothetical protein n=1 Tax=Cupriavidus taiwanensis TaxID=164546 RepID=UPI0025402096|nr:hypothetical protein [Cupriavidus taiwanensis]MDK3025537.1 hypothetical protein [Cupriavidus taiwanensis]
MPDKNFVDIPSEVASVPPVYNGHGFPVEKLSPDKFEQFVFACLGSVADLFGLRITGMPSGSGDGGFDVMGQNIRTGRIVCIQCKRQQDPLSTPLVAEELAKVAATSALARSDVGEHRFICTGGVRNKLVNQLREKSRRALAAGAFDRIATAKDGELASLRARLEAENYDVRDVVYSYVTKLDDLVAWSFHEFDVALSPRWPVILPIAERFFTIATVVREYPRASFDRATYVAAHRDFEIAIEPRLRASHLPAGVTASSAADPGSLGPSHLHDVITIDRISELEPGSFAMLTGDGGSGKSAALRLLRARVLQSSSEAMLPVLLSLSTYASGGLDRAIDQELGVEHGSWRSLPDRILLLCDGLNECPAAQVDGFLSELKLLLNRRRVACVISTRKATGRVKIVLPQAPAVCAGLDEITPVGIRRIAEHELGPDEAEGFIASYRELADASHSKLLWTPFAVMVGVKLWRVHSRLPHTLATMLDALLTSRVDRNVELSQSQLSPEVILLLAEAVAFQCLVVDGRLECPAVEAGRWIREAKARCNDGLGVADLTETKAVELLVEHNLIHRSANGNFTFDHQLVAGALAAPLLSRSWRSCVGSLEDTISDDAWVFAANMVPEEDVIEYLTAILDRDLVLGARAARELPAIFQTHAMALLVHCVEPRSPEHVRINAAYALAVLGTEDAVSKLKELARDKRDPIHHAIQRAIAATGDVDYLTQVLDLVDPIRSTPVRMSGGEADIWDHAPLPARLDIVRGRLAACTPGEPVGESLRLLAFERDVRDVALVETHLAASRDVNAWGNAIRALQMIAPVRAKLAVERDVASIPNVDGRARLLRIAALAGVPVDLQEAFECAIAELVSEGTSGRSGHDLCLLISDVIEKTGLSPAQVSVIECELPRSTGSRRARLWQLAFGCNSASIGEFAMSCIAAWGRDAGSACQYFIAQPDMANAHRLQLIVCCERAIEGEEHWYSWETGKALELLQKLGGFSSKTARVLSAMIERAVRIVSVAREQNIADLSETDKSSAETLPTERADIHLELVLASRLPVVARSRAMLAPNVLTSLLWIDFHTAKSHWPDIRLALCDIRDDFIDAELIRIRDLSARVTSLAIVCTRGATPVRVLLLGRALKECYHHPGLMTLMEAAVEACWCGEVLEMVLKFVRDIEVWSEYDSQFFWPFTRMVARKVDEEDRTAIERAQMGAESEFARRILQIWRSQTLGQRVGLSSREL